MSRPVDRRSGPWRRVHRRAWVLAPILFACGCIPSRSHLFGTLEADRVMPPIVRAKLPHSARRMIIRSDGRFVLYAFLAGSADPVTYSTEDDLTLRFGRHRIDVIGAKGVTLVRGAMGLAARTLVDSGVISVDKTPYYGTLIIGYNTDGAPLVVNRLNLDTYLTGVLFPELGERAPNESEAIRAQAVAARTYALAHLGQYGLAPYDLRTDVGDQVYVGASQRRGWIDTAVAATRGEVLTSLGHLIDAYYHSTCGGRTDAIEDIWPKPPRPYLVSVDDDTFCRWSKYTTWTESFDGKTLVQNLRAYRRQLNPKPIEDFRTVEDIELARGTPGGRIVSMTVVTPVGRWTIAGDQVRWVLGRPSRPGTILPSGHFELALRRDKKGRVKGATATGSGYGHGVGMCQCGMIGRARAGQQYPDILRTYYPGTELVRAY